MYKLYFGFCFEYYKRMAQTAIASFVFSSFFFFIQWNWSPVKLSLTFVESAERVLELYCSGLLFRTHFFNASRHNWQSTSTLSTIPPPLAITPWLIDHLPVTRATRSLRSWDIRPISARSKSMFSHAGYSRREFFAPAIIRDTRWLISFSLHAYQKFWITFTFINIHLSFFI